MYVQLGMLSSYTVYFVPLHHLLWLYFLLLHLLLLLFSSAPYLFTSIFLLFTLSFYPGSLSSPPPCPPLLPSSPPPSPPPLLPPLPLTAGEGKEASHQKATKRLHVVHEGEEGRGHQAVYSQRISSN